MSIAHISECPLDAEMKSGEILLWFKALTLAPVWIRTSDVPRCPSWHERWRAVDPLLLTAFTSAPGVGKEKLTHSCVPQCAGRNQSCTTMTASCVEAKELRAGVLLLQEIGLYLHKTAYNGTDQMRILHLGRFRTGQNQTETTSVASPSWREV